MERISKLVWFWAGAMALLTVAVGCRGPEEVRPSELAYYQNPDLTPWTVRRVVLLPLENTTPFPHAHALLADAVANELQASGLFEVVNLSHHLDLVGGASVTSGHFDEQVLVDMAHLHHADAVIVGRVTDYHPYWPQRIGLTLHLIGTYDANVLLSLSGAWDGHDEVVVGRFKQHFSRLSSSTQLSRADISIHAPHYFAAFVANDIARSISVRWHAEHDVAVANNEESPPTTPP